LATGNTLQLIETPSLHSDRLKALRFARILRPRQVTEIYSNWKL